jgi:hypothetical protein
MEGSLPGESGTPPKAIALWALQAHKTAPAAEVCFDQLCLAILVAAFFAATRSHGLAHVVRRGGRPGAAAECCQRLAARAASAATAASPVGVSAIQRAEATRSALVQQRGVSSSAARSALLGVHARAWRARCVLKNGALGAPIVGTAHTLCLCKLAFGSNKQQRKAPVSCRRAERLGAPLHAARRRSRLGLRRAKKAPRSARVAHPTQPRLHTYAPAKRTPSCEVSGGLN